MATAGTGNIVLSTLVDDTLVEVLTGGVQTGGSGSASGVVTGSLIIAGLNAIVIDTDGALMMDGGTA